MSYGTLKVDNIIFTKAGSDQTISVSGLAEAISGNIVSTGTIQALTIIGTNNITGSAVNAGSATFTGLTSVSGIFTATEGNSLTFVSGSGTHLSLQSGKYNSFIEAEGYFLEATGSVVRPSLIGRGLYSSASGVLTLESSSDTFPFSSVPLNVTPSGIGILTSTPTANLSFSQLTDTTPSDVRKIHLYNSGGLIAGFGVSNDALNYRSVANHTWYNSSGVQVAGLSDSAVFTVGSANTYEISGLAASDMQVSKQDQDSTFGVVCWKADDLNFNPVINIMRSYTNVEGTHSAMPNDAALGRIRIAGSEGNVFRTGVEIAGQADGSAWDPASCPARLTVSITKSGSVTPTEALRISNDHSVTISEGGNIVLGTTSGTKIGTSTSQKIGFYNATPVIQQTTGVSEAAFVENAGGAAVNVDSTFGGYTVQQVVQALKNLGLLA